MASLIKTKKEIYDEQYEATKKGGEMFFPDSLLKDAIVILGISVILIVLSFVFPAHSGAIANPSSVYIAKPDWYFLFFVQFLKFFPGWAEPIATILIPLIFIVLLFCLPFIDKGMDRRWSKRKWVLIIGTLVLVILGVLEIIGALSLESTPTNIM